MVKKIFKRINKYFDINRYPITCSITIISMAVFLLWVFLFASRLTYSSIQLTLSSITQASATLLGLIIIAYIFTTERADKSVDYLQDVKKSYYKRLDQSLELVIESVWRRIISGQLEDFLYIGGSTYVTDVLSSLFVLKFSLDVTYDPPKEALGILLQNSKERTHEIYDDLKTELVAEGANAKSTPQAFIDHFYKVSFYLSLIDEECPDKKLFDDFLEFYHENLISHVGVIDDAEWLRGLVGKGLMIILGLTFIISVVLLSVCNDAVEILYLTRGLCLTLLLLFIDLILIARIVDWLFL